MTKNPVSSSHIKNFLRKQECTGTGTVECTGIQYNTGNFPAALPKISDPTTLMTA
jgi:hypothetical protein